MELELELAEINYTGDDLLHVELEIKHRYGLISDNEYADKKAELISDPVERQVSLVMALLERNEITALEAEKQIATLRGEPWIKVINDGFLDETKGPDSYFFEFDWNDVWINELKEAGYAGTSDEAIIQVWFQDVCRMEASASLGTPPINRGLIVT
jgi:hypothetical protein